MPRPNLICPGAQKSGSTTLYNILIQHPDIFLSKTKESKFFVRDSEFVKGVDYYEKEFFHSWNSQKVIAEIDPEYFFFERAAERMAQTLGNQIKLIFLLRNPVERAYSHYLMSISRGYENESFSNAIKLENSRIGKNFFQADNFSYISRGLYAKQLQHFLKYFKMKNMLFLIFEEDIIVNLSATTNRIFDFLEIPRIKNISTNVKYNPAKRPKNLNLRDFIYGESILRVFGKKLIPGKKFRAKIMNTLDEFNQKDFQKPEISQEFKKSLIETYFRKDIAKLEELIQKDISVWFTDRKNEE